MGVDASVEVMSFQADPASRPAWIITVECDDRPGLLAATVGALRVLEINVLSADVRTHQGTATNRFQVELREGLRPQAVVDALKAAIKGGAGGAA